MKPNNENYELSMKSKVLILFMDYLMIILIISILRVFHIPFIEEHSILFWFIVYVLYYVLPEWFFKRTLAMRFQGVHIVDLRNNSSIKSFLIYSFLAFFDRIVFLIVYLIVAMLMFDYRLLLSEKLSGLRWRKTRKLLVDN